MGVYTTCVARNPDAVVLLFVCWLARSYVGRSSLNVDIELAEENVRRLLLCLPWFHLTSPLLCASAAACRRWLAAATWQGPRGVHQGVVHLRCEGRRQQCDGGAPPCDERRTHALLVPQGPVAPECAQAVPCAVPHQPAAHAQRAGAGVRAVHVAGAQAGLRGDQRCHQRCRGACSRAQQRHHHEHDAHLPPPEPQHPRKGVRRLPYAPRVRAVQRWCWCRRRQQLTTQSMRRFELAWITARNFAGKPPVFVALDDIQFRAPVSIGDVISFTASVEYSQGGYSWSLQLGILCRRVVLACGRS